MYALKNRCKLKQTHANTHTHTHTHWLVISSRSSPTDSRVWTHYTTQCINKQLSPQLNLALYAVFPSGQLEHIFDKLDLYSLKPNTGCVRWCCHILRFFTKHNRIKNGSSGIHLSFIQLIFFCKSREGFPHHVMVSVSHAVLSVLPAVNFNSAWLIPPSLTFTTLCPHSLDIWGALFHEDEP